MNKQAKLNIKARQKKKNILILKKYAKDEANILTKILT